jgi:hypothetical protein
MLRLEWRNINKGIHFQHSGGKSFLNAWRQADGWHYCGGVDRCLIESGTKPTLLEAQQAAETALKDALKPYAESYARLGGEI